MPLETIMPLPAITLSRRWPDALHPRPGLWRHARVGLGHLTGAMLRAYQARRASRQLMACSDLLLHDIGLGRSEITRVVRHGRD
jgi:uncharacterized protein YjiS (DUF1127 family)